MRIKLIIILLAALATPGGALAYEMPQQLRGAWCWREDHAAWERCKKIRSPPEAKGQPNLVIRAEDSQRERLVFPLEDETELHLPVREDVLRKLYETLKKRFE